MLVTDAIAKTLTSLGVDTVFGVVGSGNFHVTNALIAHGAKFIAARHECGAASMADAWARLSGRPGVLSVHQGPGLTNALTGITEAAKARTPLAGARRGCQLARRDVEFPDRRRGRRRRRSGRHRPGCGRPDSPSTTRSGRSG